MAKCEGCGGPDSRDFPLVAYRDGSAWHDDCAEEAGIDESEMG